MQGAAGAAPCITHDNRSIMKIRTLTIALLAALALGSCYKPSYVGKSYPQTGAAPEIFVDWRDVPYDYETMGYATAYSSGYAFGLGSDAGAQQKLEELARARGADAIVIAPPESEPVRQRVEQVEQNSNSTVHTTTVTQRETRADGKLTAAFIKYKR